MAGYILRRILQMIPVLLLLSLFIFFLIRFIPGDPARAIAGERATEEMVSDLRVRLRLDQPLWEQYGAFLGDLLQGDMGDSIRKQDSVASLLTQRMPPTIFLAIYASVLALLITMPMSAIAALNNNRWPDHAIRAFAMCCLAMPAYWIGLMLMQFLAVKYELFPVSGYGKGFFEHLEHLFLPALALALGISSVLVRNLRSSLLETLQADYVRTARAKGLSGRAVFVWHVLRTSAVTTITILSVNFAYLIGGAAVIETIFSIPGIGQLVVSSIFSRDYPVIQGATLFFGLLVLVISLIIDLVYAALDPRVQYR